MISTELMQASAYTSALVVTQRPQQDPLITGQNIGPDLFVEHLTMSNEEPVREIWSLEFSDLEQLTHPDRILTDHDQGGVIQIIGAELLDDSSEVADRVIFVERHGELLKGLTSYQYTDPLRVCVLTIR